jgi:hypothetical protein
MRDANGTLPFDLLAFATTIGQGYSMTVGEHHAAC